MIGIYQDDFIEYLKRKLGDHIKTSSKNIICPCPFCEFGEEKSHYHMYISIEIPIFHCFHANCEKSGSLKKLLKKLEGHDISDEFVDKEKLAEITKQRKIFTDQEKTQSKIQVPIINSSKFMLKDMYMKQRLKFSRTTIGLIKGLIFDVDAFIEMNDIIVDEGLFRMREYLQQNFVGFLTENNSTVIFRIIDHSHSVRFYKLKIQQSNFLDYYKLSGNNQNSNKIVLAEGIFDIFTEHIFDTLNIKQNIKLYASALSSKYISLIHSIIFHEQVFQPDIIILSDRGIGREYYKKLKKYNKHIINRLDVYYNKTGKDFNDTPVTPIKYTI
ncbi:MAG: hypothetical protein DRI84_09840 [Bacteroidetes bacterium]|nr:MAG: hypothetical protein DRI84_09840 [Bacteroidota bacterium]